GDTDGRVLTHAGRRRRWTSEGHHRRSAAQRTVAGCRRVCRRSAALSGGLRSGANRVRGALSAAQGGSARGIRSASTIGSGVLSTRVCLNFSHNILKGIVVDALLWGEPWTLTLNDLLTGVHTEPSAAESKKKLANTLVAYARSSPDTIRGRLMPVIVYDPRAGRQAFSFMMRILAG